MTVENISFNGDCSTHKLPLYLAIGKRGKCHDEVFLGIKSLRSGRQVSSPAAKEQRNGSTLSDPII